MVEALLWLLILELLGIVALPLAYTLCSRLPDRGYTLSKPIALVLFSYILWLLGLTHIIPNSRITIIAILVLGAVVAGWLLRRRWGDIRAFLVAEWRALLVAESVFLGFFLLWLFIVSEAPAINHTEKPMDFGFMNAVLRSRYFPPEDPWLAGHPISYYYFGHFMMAFLAKLTGVPSSVGYNLAVASLPALVGIGSFGLVYNLVRLSGGRGGYQTRTYAIGFGLVAPVLVMVIGNLEGAMEFVRLQGWGGDGFWRWLGIKGLDAGVSTPTGRGGFPDQPWWWWRATRVIDTLVDGRSLDYTITEFPFFSFLLGDLHPHVMSLPFLLLNLSLGLNLFLSPEPPGLGWLRPSAEGLRRHGWELGAGALFLGVLAFINLVDFPVFAAILGLILLVKSYGAEKGDLPRAAGNAALVLGPVVVAAVVMFLPFYLTFNSQASGIGRVGAVSTRPFLFFLVMGLFFLLGVSFLARQLPGLARPGREDGQMVQLLLIVLLVPFLLWVAIGLVLSPFGDGIISALAQAGRRFLWILPGLVIIGVAGFSAAQSAYGGRLGPDSIGVVGFPLLLLAVAFYLLAGAELFYLVDLFGNRMNTVFKVYYQAWLLLAIVGAYGLYYWQSHRPGAHPNGPRWRRASLHAVHYAWSGAVAVLLVASLYYPVGAALDRTGILSRGHTVQDNTLDGLAFLRDSEPGEYAAIVWLRSKDPWGRIAEAVGDDYSDHGRISASTGLPTILGWRGHELQWRGSSVLFAGRAEDVARIYQSQDIQVAQRLLQKYDVRYVYVGRRERARYGGDQLTRFGEFMRIAFAQDGVVIYERLDRIKQGAETSYAAASG